MVFFKGCEQQHEGGSPEIKVITSFHLFLFISRMKGILFLPSLALLIGLAMADEGGSGYYLPGSMAPSIGISAKQGGG